MHVAKMVVDCDHVRSRFGAKSLSCILHHMVANTKELHKIVCQNFEVSLFFVEKDSKAPKEASVSSSVYS